MPAMSEQALHILIIDNNQLRASIIEDGLREGARVRVTVLGETTELLRRISEVDPAVIFIDL